MATDKKSDVAANNILSETRLFIGGLAPEVTELDLRDRFSAFGKITDVDLIKREGLKRFGYISILPSQANSITKCLTSLHKSKWKGYQLNIEKAREHWKIKFDREKELHRQELDEKRKRIEEEKPTLDFGDKWWIDGPNGTKVLKIYLRSKNGKKIRQFDANLHQHRHLKRFPQDSSGFSASAIDWTDMRDPEKPEKKATYKARNFGTDNPDEEDEHLRRRKKWLAIARGENGQTQEKDASFKVLEKMFQEDDDDGTTGRVVEFEETDLGDVAMEDFTEEAIDEGKEVELDEDLRPSKRSQVQYQSDSDDEEDPFGVAVPVAKKAKISRKDEKQTASSEGKASLKILDSILGAE
eukprot:TRINITY_DN4698_c0_g1_i1.p1 TRINITY_DN4698_c0_g1~~TRINITY_DN4698_c0_g1_i1.p1  ORF type:complete len:354 (+),score=91.81 TRINITY_DN4698_c0_g1_i1:61-1122(+)